MSQRLTDTPHTRASYSDWFGLCIALSVCCLIAANTIAVKLISVGGHVVPGGAIVYPISFIVSDVVTEVYGYHAARRIIWISFAANLIFVAAAQTVSALPAPSYWSGQPAYDRILGYTPRLLAGAFASFLVGDFANAIVMSTLKVQTAGRFLWLRAVSSTVVGQGLDSVIFVIVAFGGSISWGQVADVATTVWVFKCVYEVCALPLTYLVVGRLKTAEGLNAFDRDISYSPFSVGWFSSRFNEHRGSPLE